MCDSSAEDLCDSFESHEVYFLIDFSFAGKRIVIVEMIVKLWVGCF